MVAVRALDGGIVREVELPEVFRAELRPDLIRRAFLAETSLNYQPKGTDVRAGKRTTAEPWGKGFGVSRVPRIKGSRYHAAGKGAFSPSTVGGRAAHPPKVEKRLVQKVNKKEYRLALKSAIAATAKKELVEARGHEFEAADLPIIVVADAEKLKKTKEVMELFKRLGLWSDVERAKEGKKIRAGKGKMRGRRYRKPKGPLVVTGSPDCDLLKAARNLPGVDVADVRALNLELLAPGGVPGRLTVWTESAIEQLKSL